MRHYLSLAAIAAAAFTFTATTADAAKKRERVHVTKQQDNRLRDTSLGVGGGLTAGYLVAGATTGAGVATTAICFPLAPIVATTAVNRELTMREAHVLLGSCLIPIVGGYLVNQAWENYPELTPAPENSKRVRTARR